MVLLHLIEIRMEHVLRYKTFKSVFTSKEIVAIVAENQSVNV